MKKIILLLTLISSFVYAESINFETTLKLAIENSSEIKALNENLRINEIEKNSVTLPGSIYLDASAATPSLQFDSDGNSSVQNGSVSLSIEPIDGLSIGSTNDFESNLKSASISYTPLRPKSNKMSIIDRFDISTLELKEKKKEFIKNLKKSYQNLIYNRSLIELKNRELELLKRELIIDENRIASGLDSSNSIQESKQKLLDSEIDLLNYEMTLLKLEVNFSSSIGRDIRGIKLEPLTLPEMEDIEVLTDEENLKEFKQSSEYLYLITNVTSSYTGLKEKKLSLIPTLTIGANLFTENYSDYTGSVIINANFSSIFNAKQEIERQSILLDKAKRELEDGMKVFNHKMIYKDIENSITIKKIKLLNLTHEKNLKSIEIYDFKYKQGEILKEVLEKEILYMQMNKLLLENTKNIFVIENMK